jgi:AraC-like DNA-binding protein
MKLLCGVRNARVDYRPLGGAPLWRVTSVRIRPGLLCVASQLDAAHAARFDFEINTPPVQFGGMLCGRNCRRYASGELKGREVVSSRGDNGIVCLPDTRGSVQCAPGEDACVLTLLATPQFLLEAMGEGCGEAALSGWLRGLMAGRPEQLLWRGRRSARKDFLLAALLENLRRPPAWRLMQESMALELIWLQLEECAADQGHAPKAPRITRGDEERLVEARRLLLSDLENPPSIGELARLSGLSEKKLKVGFPRLFGDTVYGCFRSHRLEHARKLIEEDRLSVSEVAYSVGYLNLSHFSQAFRRRFGMNPSNLLRGRSTGNE